MLRSSMSIMSSKLPKFDNCNFNKEQVTEFDNCFFNSLALISEPLRETQSLGIMLPYAILPETLSMS